MVVVDRVGVDLQFITITVLKWERYRATDRLLRQVEFILVRKSIQPAGIMAYPMERTMGTLVAEDTTITAIIITTITIMDTEIVLDIMDMEVITPTAHHLLWPEEGIMGIWDGGEAIVEQLLLLEGAAPAEEAGAGVQMRTIPTTSRRAALLLLVTLIIPASHHLAHRVILVALRLDPRPPPSKKRKIRNQLRV